MRNVVLLAAILATGCSNLNAPTPIDKQARWALAHINEVCVTHGEWGPGYLLPVNAPFPAGDVMHPISYCNPAE